MPDIISSDHPLSEAQKATLTALLDTLVPASDDGAMPSAADTGFDAYLRTQAQDLLPALAGLLNDFEPGFAELSLTDRCARVTDFSNQQPEVFQALLAHVYDCYYQNDRVRTQIGMVTGPVFPQGNEVPVGDLSLLDPVIKNSDNHGYRVT